MRNSVIITSPSLEVRHNVSGISNLTRLIIEHNQSIQYRHFRAGSKDKSSTVLEKLIGFALYFPRFMGALIGSPKCRLVHINMPLARRSIVRDTMFVMLARAMNRKVILHLRGGQYSLCKEVSPYLRWMIRKSLLLSSEVIVLGELEKEFITEFYGVSPLSFTVLPNAVLVPDLKLPKDYQGPLRILYVGRMDQRKGLHEIVQALGILKEHVSFHFSFAGEGPDKDYFILECEREIPGLYEYLGVIGGIEKDEAFARSHIFLMPSYFEGLPNAMLEAMAWKLVPVVTPVGSIPEVVEDSENGCLIPIKDHKPIVDWIRTLDADRALLEGMGIKAQKTIREQYELNSYIGKLNQIYMAVNDASR